MPRLNDTLIRHARLVLPDRLIETGFVLVEDGKITSVGESMPSSHDAGEIIDAGGSYLAPGFVDIHVHGGGGADFMDGTTDAVETALATHTRHGTTTIFPTTTTGSPAQIDAMLELGGLDWAVDRCARSSEIIYSWAEASDVAYPFVTDADMRSTNVATINFVDSVDADTIAAVLRDNGIVDTGGYRALGQNQLRLAMFPNVEPSDLETLTKAIDYIIERM